MKKFNRNGNLPMNLQFFADPAPAADPVAPPPTQAAAPTASQPIDYGKIQQMLDGTLSAKEDTALKAYFKQQGMSQEDAESAMTAFKQQKAAQQPDVTALQTQAAQAQAAVQHALVENKAILTAIELGLDAKTVPYILKMADLSKVAGADGVINEDALKTALNKVLEDVPALKPTPGQTTGFMQVGASGGTNQQTNTDDALKKAFGL